MRLRLLNQRYLWTALSLGCLLSLGLIQKDVDPSHALYLSITEIELGKDKAGQIRVKVFSDDLQNALRNYSTSYQAADLKAFFAKNEALAAEYFSKHLQISWDKRVAKYQFVDYEIANDAHFVTFRFRIPNDVSSISVEADFFMELFPTQTNVVKINRAGEQHYFKFTKPSQPQRFTWTR